MQEVDIVKMGHSGRAVTLALTLTATMVASGCAKEKTGADGTATVTVLGSRLVVPAHPKVAAGTTGAYLMTRPETVGLTPVTDGGTGIGMVLRSTFNGPAIDYEVETSAGTITVTKAGVDPREALAEGVNVNVTFNPDRAYLLTQD